MICLPLVRYKSSRALGSLLSLPLVVALAGCGDGTSREPMPGQDVNIAEARNGGLNVNATSEAACEPAHGPGMTVVDAFDTTVGGVRKWQAQQIALDMERTGMPSSEGDGQAPWFSDLSDATAAVLCYLDGTVNKAPPPIPGGRESAPFNRSVVAVLEDGSSIAVTLGYQETIPVHAPPRS